MVGGRARMGGYRCAVFLPNGGESAVAVDEGGREVEVALVGALGQGVLHVDGDIGVDGGADGDGHAAGVADADTVLGSDGVVDGLGLIRAVGEHTVDTVFVVAGSQTAYAFNGIGCGPRVGGSVKDGAVLAVGGCDAELGARANHRTGNVFHGEGVVEGDSCRGSGRTAFAVGNGH